MSDKNRRNGVTLTTTSEIIPVDEDSITKITGEWECQRHKVQGQKSFKFKSISKKTYFLHYDTFDALWVIGTVEGGKKKSQLCRQEGRSNEGDPLTDLWRNSDWLVRVRAESKDKSANGDCFRAARIKVCEWKENERGAVVRAEATAAKLGDRALDQLKLVQASQAKHQEELEKALLAVATDEQEGTFDEQMEKVMRESRAAMGSHEDDVMNKIMEQSKAEEEEQFKRLLELSMKEADTLNEDAPAKRDPVSLAEKKKRGLKWYKRNKKNTAAKREDERNLMETAEAEKREYDRAVVVVAEVGLHVPSPDDDRKCDSCHNEADQVGCLFVDPADARVYCLSCWKSYYWNTPPLGTRRIEKRRPTCMYCHQLCATAHKDPSDGKDYCDACWSLYYGGGQGLAGGQQWGHAGIWRDYGDGVDQWGGKGGEHQWGGSLLDSQDDDSRADGRSSPVVSNFHRSPPVSRRNLLDAGKGGGGAQSGSDRNVLDGEQSVNPWGSGRILLEQGKGVGQWGAGGKGEGQWGHGEISNGSWGGGEIEQWGYSWRGKGGNEWGSESSEGNGGGGGAGAPPVLECSYCRRFSAQMHIDQLDGSIYCSTCWSETGHSSPQPSRQPGHRSLGNPANPLPAPGSPVRKNDRPPLPEKGMSFLI
jgi:hypothetical protein